MQDKLKEQYLDSLENKAEAIKSLWDRYLRGDKQALENIHLHAHSLKGSGTTFGFPEVSEAGRQLEQATASELSDKVRHLLDTLGRVTSGGHGSAANEETSPAPVIPATRDALIIERNTDNAEVMARCIRKLDDIDDCLIAGTASEARKLFRSRRFALVILDLVLPDQDGREILREIKGSTQYSSPVLVISGVPSDNIYLECMNIGADQYLSKPFDTDKLYFESRQVLLSSRGYEPSAPVPVESGEETGSSRLLHLEGENILVVEDDEMQAIFMSQKLTEQGAQVACVENGRLALEALESHSYSAVVMDGMMPEMDGFETLQAIRRQSALKNLPVVMVTAMGSEDDIIRGYQCGANDYILKPFSEEQLVSRIRKLLLMAA